MSALKVILPALASVYPKVGETSRPLSQADIQLVAPEFREPKILVLFEPALPISLRIVPTRQASDIGPVPTATALVVVAPMALMVVVLVEAGSVQLLI